MISAVVIAKNEERNIGPCIEALSKVTSDIHLLDSGSTDRTKELAKKKGATIHEVQWKGYGPTKNEGANFAKYDWILSIDADEVLTDALVEELLVLELDSHKIYAINILTNYCGTWIRHSGWFPSYKKRLYNKKLVSWDEREVHENLRWGDKKIEICHLNNELLHYSYRSPEDHVIKGKRYAKLGAEHLIQSKKKVFFAKQLVGPPFRFFKMYVIKRGFLDGSAGFLLAIREARMVAWRYQFYRALKKQQDGTNN